MNENDLTKAILNVLKKELGSIGDAIPSDMLNGIKKKITPEIHRLVEKSGYVATSLNEYKNKIERGPQSVLMYAQAAGLSDSDIKELSKYIVSL